MLHKLPPSKKINDGKDCNDCKITKTFNLRTSYSAALYTLT